MTSRPLVPRGGRGRAAVDVWGTRRSSRFEATHTVYEREIGHGHGKIRIQGQTLACAVKTAQGRAGAAVSV
jgi:hypothetical protein